MKKRGYVRRRSIGIYPVLPVSFSLQASHSSLKDTKYSCVLMEHLQEKTSCAKLHSTSKRRVFLQEQAKSHGNADAYRGFLTHYWGKTPFLKRVTPLWSAALPLSFYNNIKYRSCRNRECCFGYRASHGHLPAASYHRGEPAWCRCVSP